MHDTGYFSAQPSLEDRWQQVLSNFYFSFFHMLTRKLVADANVPSINTLKRFNDEMVKKLQSYLFVFIFQCWLCK